VARCGRANPGRLGAADQPGPVAGLELRPEGTKALLRRSQDWLLGHAFQLMAGIALALGAYLTVSGLVRLS